MIVGVNSRIYQNKNTGIPYFVECLYKQCLSDDKKNKYLFFQTKRNKTLGNTKILNLRHSIASAFLFDLFLVNTLIKKANVKVFHGPSNILPLVKQKGVKYIVTVHDLSFLLFSSHHSKLFNVYYKYFVGKSLKNADAITADSLNTKRDIIKYYGINAKKISVLYPGVNEIFLTSQKVKRIVKEKYFLTLSTHPKRKNIYKILDILSSNKDLDKLVFVIAGLIPSEQVDQLREKIKELKIEKRVVIFGYASEQDLVSLYRYAEFFIYPSYYEGFGFPVVEAMSSKCPVLASNTSSIPELMPSKKWLFDPYDTESISKTMSAFVKLSNESKKNLVKTNFNFAKKFTWEKSAKQMIELFER